MRMTLLGTKRTVLAEVKPDDGLHGCSDTR